MSIRLMMGAIISRYAPAPTGFLHLGHVVNAIYVWGMTRRMRGRVLLRIEDHDRQRSRPEFEREIVEDLAWLGFAADEPPVRQSERGAMYEHALDTLRAKGVVYACRCSRAEIAAAIAGSRGPVQTERRDPGGRPGPVDPASNAFSELRYPGTCRDRALDDAPGRAVRVRLDPSVERFDDLRHGPQEQRPSEQCGDLVVRDREGNWTYQFAATVDDFVQHVTLVIRGDDLLDSTGRQLQLARLLGRAEAPRFLHHPLVMKSAQQKLSKSDGDTGVRELRARGWSAARVIGEAAAQAGLISAPRDVAASDVSSIIG